MTAVVVIAALLLAAPAAGSNRLAGEASPYLQMHAENPVDWYPWGEEAFARSRAESKPVFLSVGYSTCYWCHVMERQVFSNPEIAALMNARFVNVKVDREERPDVDEIYMQATRILTRSGGWPNSVFLTPEGDPFYAGTYFPPEDAPGRPGFPRVIAAVSEAWESDRPRVLALSREVASAIARASESTGSVELPAPGVLLARARIELASTYEPEHGGFSQGVKFPRPPLLQLLLAAHERSGDEKTLAMLTHTLDEMALGGIYDHLGGGFHRYSTEGTWSIPHFEKMLYDNAQLLSVYAAALERSGRPLYRYVVDDVARYLARDLLGPEGGFYSAQDAEVDHVEGKSYLWSRDEIEAVLGARTGAFFEVYELAPTREDPALGVLRVRLAVEGPAPRMTALETERSALLATRSRRPQPLRDEKVLCAWNGLAMRGLVDAARATGQREYVRMAEAAGHFALARLRSSDGGLARSYIFGRARERGVLEDYVFLIDGLLALHEATGVDGWLSEARELADVLIARFEDETFGGFFLTVEDHDLIVRPKPFEDGVMPSGNGAAARVLGRLAVRTGEPRYANAGRSVASALSEVLAQSPSRASSLVLALNETPAPVASRSASRDTAPPERARLPRSEDHVRVELDWVADAPERATVRLRVAPGWHVNANPPSLAFLIATRVVGDRVTDVGYPAGKELRPEFASESISVYEGEVELAVSLLPGAPGSGAPGTGPLEVHYQACDERSCLPPSVATLSAATR